MGKILRRVDTHLFSKFGQAIAFEPERLRIFQVNPITFDILKSTDGKTLEELVELLIPRYSPEGIKKTVGKLMEAGLITTSENTDGAAGSKGVILSKDQLVINRIVLYTSQSCNLKCKYCFSNFHEAPQEKRMSNEIARGAVDFLFQQLGDTKRAIIAFFGGEPLLNFDCIRETVKYADEKAMQLGKEVEYSITTNGTLLTDSIMDFLVTHRFMIGLSLDGGETTHDANRIFPNGSGSHAIVLKNFKKLKEKKADVTVQTVINHAEMDFSKVANELLAAEVHNFKILECNLPDGDIQFRGAFDTYRENYDRMIEGFLREKKEQVPLFPLNFFSLFQYLEKRELTWKPCPAGSKQVAVNTEGDFLPCKNFITHPQVTMGNVFSGFDKSLQSSFLEVNTIDVPACGQCWARTLCSGPCAHSSYQKHGKFNEPVETICTVKRHLMETGLAAYAYYKSRDKDFLKKWQRRRYHGGQENGTVSKVTSSEI